MAHPWAVQTDSPIGGDVMITVAGISLATSFVAICKYQSFGWGGSVFILRTVGG